MATRFSGWVLLLWLSHQFLSVAAIGAERQAFFVSFSAKNRRGIFLRDLKAEEVRVLVDNQPMEVRYFGYKSVDTAFAFLIENSPRTAEYPVSMPHMNQINIVDVIRYYLLDGAMYMVASHGPTLVAEFYKELKILQDFSSDDMDLTEAIQRMEPNFRGLDEENIPVARFIGRGVDLLRATDAKRKILVLFTTTINRDAVDALEEYRELLRMSNVDLFVVSFAPQFASASSSHAERVNRFYFKQLVGETSGKLYLSGAYVFPEEFMKDLEVRLDNTYTLGFYVEPGDEPTEHSLDIQLTRPKCEVVHRRKLVF